MPQPVPHSTFHWTNASTQSRLFAQTWRPSNPRAVLIVVHGLGEHSGRYAHVAAFFAQQQVATVALDHYGHGQSEGKRGHIPRYEYFMEIIDELIAQVKPQFEGLPLYLWGHSMGGNIVLGYLLRHRPQPMAGVVVTGPAVRPGFEPPKLMVALGKITRRIYPSFTQPNQLDVKGLSRDPAVVKAYQDDPLVHDRLSSELGIGLLEWGQWLLDHQHTAPLPLLVMHGTADRLTSPKATEAFFANVTGNATLKLWEGFFHELHNEPEQHQVLSYLWQWMQTVALAPQA